MNVLLLDAGNTRLKWGLCERGRFLHRGEFSYDWSALPKQFTAQWSALLNAGSVEKVVLCNVAGDRLESPLRQWLADSIVHKKSLQETAPLTIENVVAQPQAFGVQCAYEQPAQLGADRWAALVAARHHVTGASCVIDCGTALTIDVLTVEGVHVGGLIAPGMTTMRQSLLENTAQIDVDVATDSSLFSVRDTASAVQAGIMAATVGMVQQALQQCDAHGQPAPVCVVTGGNAQALLPSLPEGSLHDAEWVLKGLAIIAGCRE